MVLSREYMVFIWWLFRMCVWFADQQSALVHTHFRGQQSEPGARSERVRMLSIYVRGHRRRRHNVNCGVCGVHTRTPWHVVVNCDFRLWQSFVYHGTNNGEFPRART